MDGRHRPLARLGYATQHLSFAWITKKLIYTSISTGFSKQKMKVSPGISLFMIAFINKSQSSICNFFLKSDRINFLTIFMYAVDWQSLGVWACTPALPVGNSEGRVEHLGLHHLDWHNSTALMNSALDIRGNIQIRPRPPRSPQC